MKLGLVPMVFVLGVCAARRSAASSPGLWFEVTRSTDARACPDAQHLAQTVERLFGVQAVRLSTNKEEASLLVSISVERTEAGYSALLRVHDERGSERRIVDADADCRGLPEALAVSLALLVEPDAQAHRERARERSVERDGQSLPRRAHAPTDLYLEGGGVLGTGLLGELGSPTFGAFLGATLTRGAAGVRLRGLRLLRGARTFQEGALVMDAWALSFGPCIRLALPRAFALLPCAELGLGTQRGEAQNYEVNRSDAGPWRVLFGSASLSAPLSGLLRATGSVGGAFRLHRQNYLIDGQKAESQPTFAPFFALGLSLGFEIDDGQ